MAGNRPPLTGFALFDEIRGTDKWQTIRARNQIQQRRQINDPQHRAIIDAIAAGGSGGSGAAEMAMRVHLQALSGAMARSLAEIAVEEVGAKSAPPPRPPRRSP